MACYCYILRSEQQEKYYYGSSDDPDRRLPHHNKKKGYTQRYRPWRIVFRYKFATRKEAKAAEKLVKGWKRKKMTRLLIDDNISLLIPTRQENEILLK